MLYLTQGDSHGPCYGEIQPERRQHVREITYVTQKETETKPTKSRVVSHMTNENVCKSSLGAIESQACRRQRGNNTTSFETWVRNVSYRWKRSQLVFKLGQ